MRVDVFPLALLLPLATCLPHPRPFQTDSKDPGSDNGQTAPAPDLVKWGLGFLGIGATSWALVERQQRRRVQQQLAAAEARLRTPIEPPASAPIDAVADDAAAADAADAVAAVSPPSPALTLDVGHSWVQSWLQSDPEVEQCMIEELGDIVPVDDQKYTIVRKTAWLGAVKRCEYRLGKHLHHLSFEASTISVMRKPRPEPPLPDASAYSRSSRGAYAMASEGRRHLWPMVKANIVSSLGSGAVAGSHTVGSGSRMTGLALPHRMGGK